MKPRKPLPRSTKPLKRSELPRARRPIKVRGKPRFKGRVDEAFREYIRGLPCIIAGVAHAGRVECCHVKSRGASGADVGNCVPMCSLHHTIQHTIGRLTFEKKFAVELATLAVEYAGRYTVFHTIGTGSRYVVNP